MGKIDDNGTMRDPSSEEQSSIDEKIGGGTGRFELIDSFEVSEASYRIPRIIDNYDEVFIDIQGIQGVGNLIVQTTVGATTTTTTRLANFLSDTDKSAQILQQRINEIFYLISTAGSGATTVITPLANTESVSYDDKISKITFSTGLSSNLITKGKIKIYGRMLNNG